MLIFFIILFCFSSYKIINWYLSNKENESINQETKKAITKKDDKFVIDFNDNLFNEFLNKIKSRSVYNFNFDVSDTDNILTLSTCDNSGKKRVVMHAKKIK